MVLKRLCRAIGVAVVGLLVIALPVLAIVNPDTNPTFYAVGTTPQYKVFYNVLETGDRLFAAEELVNYAVSPNETASEAFLFEVLNTTGNETIASTTLKDYGARPIGIYMSATQVTTANATNTMDIGTALILRIMGNPLLFASPTGNSVNATLSAGDYLDQTLGADGGVATDNLMRNFLIGVADHLETYDSPPAGSEYIVVVQGVRYLTATGGSIFLEGIPALNNMCPILFQYALSTLQGDTPEATGAYVSGLSPLAKWGETSANGLTNLGVYMGFSQAQAGMMILFILTVGLALFAYSKMQSVTPVLLLVIAMMFFGAWLGLMPLALVFVISLAIVILATFFFFSQRGVM